MKATIHQPNFLPYLGFFDKCDYSNTIVLYNSTQFKKNDYQNRNRIKGKDGWFWLTIPVSYNFGDTIMSVKIDNSKSWKRDHLRALEICYSKSKYFNKYFPKLKKIYEKEWKFLSDFNIELIKFLLKELNIKCKIILSSKLEIKSKGTNALVDICKKINAETYISGKDGINYLDPNLFKNENLSLQFQKYRHPEYKQRFSNFEPYMCVLDLLFNEGPNSLNIIKNGRCYENQC